MDSTQLIVPLVGMHFRPPAKAIVAALPGGTPLILQPEPSNPYDPKAIKVLVQLAEVLEFDLRDRLLAGINQDPEIAGAILSELLGAGIPFHLGYIADSDGKECLKRQCAGNREAQEAQAEAHCEWDQLQCSLAALADGAPAIRIIYPQPQKDPQKDPQKGN